MVRLKRIIRKLVNSTGYDIRRLTPAQIGVRPDAREELRLPVPPGSRLYVGCGEDTREGYLGCDLRAVPGVALISPAWRVSAHCHDLAEIYTRHMLEHLTWEEANLAVADWHRALAIGGEVHIIVPDLDVHIDQWRRAEWTEDALLTKKSDARWGFAGFYGWQRQCDPRADDYEPSYWDVHKSGYNAKVMTFLLARHGFAEIEVRTEEDVHLVARAKRVLAEGERQVAPTLDGIRPDHRARYEFAAAKLSPGMRVLDAACGIGYGARILAEAHSGLSVLGVDREPHAVEYGARQFGTPGLELRVGDVYEDPWPVARFDAAVTFETIEHLEDAPRFLARLARAVRPGGTLVASTPNQSRRPFDPKQFPHHVRHHTRAEFDELLESAGFTVVERWCQAEKDRPTVMKGDAGNTLIAVARRRESA